MRIGVQSREGGEEQAESERWTPGEPAV